MEAFVSYPYDLDIIFGSEKGFTCFSLINPSSAEKHIQYIVEYVNTEHPDFSIEIPESIICDDGEEITLPSIPYQEFEDGNNIYQIELENPRTLARGMRANNKKLFTNKKIL